MLGWADSLILMVMALVVFGPRRLPQIGRQVGKLMYEFRKASNDFKYQMEEELRNAEEADRRKKDEERQQAVAAVSPVRALSDSQGGDSPVAQLGAGTTSGSAATQGVESPYPGEEVYPPPISMPAEMVPALTIPRIQPPSTGEQVPAAKPWDLQEELDRISARAANAEAGTVAGEAATVAAASELSREKMAGSATERARHD
jgi:sec-independent protein translocase protein TatB